MTEAALSNAVEYSVSEIAQAVKRTVESNFEYVRVRGEISGFRGQHSSGHCYFTLKDSEACMDAVVWKGNYPRLAFKPQEGLEVIATGKLTTFPRSSKYQIVIEQLQPAGAGALMALLEERRKKLLAEGLFEPARKRKLPFLPRVIGVITSPTGAVIRDILHRLDDRFPTQVIVWPCRVQGDTCANEVVVALKGFNEAVAGGPIPRPDIIIVARGGGSIEDLWGYNEEHVVRAVANSQIPVISAVGHETDTTLIDYVADRRAPTPTAAAEMAVPVRGELLAAIDNLGARQRLGLRRGLVGARDRLRAAGASLPRPADILAMASQRLDHAGTRLRSGVGSNLQGKLLRLTRTRARLTPGVLSQRARSLAHRVDDLSRRSQGRVERQIGQHHLRLDRGTARLDPALGRVLFGKRQSVPSLASLSDALRHARDRGRLRFDPVAAQLAPAFSRKVQEQRRQLQTVDKLLSTVGYQHVLERGFAIVTDAAGVPVRSAATLAPGELVTIRFADSQAGAMVTGDASAQRREKKSRSRVENPQATLF